ncbi:MAG TPA: SxtJ family membrane protein [Gemmatimonadaceae bacterium]
MIPSRNYDSSPLEPARRRSREGRVFALTLTGGFLFVALVASRKNAHGVTVAAFSLSVISLVAALFVPGRLEPVRRVWMKLGEAIGYVTTPILMAIVYYVILTPLGIVSRLTANRRPETGSHWRKRPPLPPAARMERQF